jgi:hypothetical protein
MRQQHVFETGCYGCYFREEQNTVCFHFFYYCDKDNDKTESHGTAIEMDHVRFEVLGTVIVKIISSKI